ncbi:hypothetical protein EUTSA_v10011922mg [Eutrema salsugineum]|uniref:Uncharacterized protein n=1 Tax=Eutrema salsugineum TaxID=72664 RepID=V4KMC3_EUTSA|nr:hypothetical protein EUTSA_v10011922mg [Eutrema salsugineum]
MLVSISDHHCEANSRNFCVVAERHYPRKNLCGLSLYPMTRSKLLLRLRCKSHSATSTPANSQTSTTSDKL